jgi:hypothetical protein
MNTVNHQSNTRAQGFALGLLLMTAIAVATPASAEEITAYGEYPATQLAEQRSALAGSMQRTAELAQQTLDSEVRANLAEQVRHTRVAQLNDGQRGRG